MKNKIKLSLKSLLMHKFFNIFLSLLKSMPFYQKKIWSSNQYIVNMKFAYFFSKFLSKMKYLHQPHAGDKKLLFSLVLVECRFTGLLSSAWLCWAHTLRRGWNHILCLWFFQKWKIFASRRAPLTSWQSSWASKFKNVPRSRRFWNF